MRRPPKSLLRPLCDHRKQVRLRPASTCALSVRHRLLHRQALPQIPRPNSLCRHLSRQSWAPWCGPARALSVAVALQRFPLVRKPTCGVACVSAAYRLRQRGPVMPMRTLATSLEPVGLDLDRDRGRVAFRDRGLERGRPNRGTAKWYEPQGLPPDGGCRKRGFV